MLRIFAARRLLAATSAIVGGALVFSSTLALADGETKKPAAATKSKEGKTKETAAPSNDYGLPQVRFINEQISAVWKDNGLTPSPAATDGEFCRRVYLDTIGRVPTVVELREYLNDKSADKKAKLVEKLLGDDYNDEYARNWTTLWTNILIGRNGGMEENTLVSRAGMQKYLRDSFARNKPYDRMVYELVTATGSTSPGAKDFNGATNFLIMKLDEGAAQATAMTAKHFLGLQVQCTQCHNHPFNEWKQQKFWEMNAFFRQTRALRKFAPGTRDVQSAELVNQDYAGDDAGGASEASVSYELRNGQMKIAFPVFIDGTEISKSGYLSEVDRRTKLGEMMIQSEFLDKTIANRMWQHFLGYGFTKPIDDMGPHNVPTHPVLLDYLGKEVRKNSFNLKELIKWIALSDAYGLSSRVTPGNKADDPLLGETPKFTHFYLRQMRAEELYESLVTATQAEKTTKGNYEEQEKTKSEWLKQFVIAFGTDEGDETTTFNGTIPQVLMMFNGDLVKKATSPEAGSFVHQLANNANIKPVDKINFLFMAGLSRQPTTNELQAAQILAATNKGNTVAAMEDIWWAVLNSNEFIINH
jgi:hypothetical protein